MIKLKRLSDRPVLTPDKSHRWEQQAVFNTAVVYENGLVHLLYRAADNKFTALGGDSPDPASKFVSSVGYAVSSDGINFNRMINPVFTGSVPQEDWGIEDPRITKIDDTYYMLYTGFGGRSWEDVRISLATSKNLIEWERQGVLLDEKNKDAAIFPEKVNGSYLLLHRREPDIWLAYSDDLENWSRHKIIMKTREDSWEESKIGIAGAPLKTEYGWILIYHGVDSNHVYRLGLAVLDLEDPSQVIYRQKEPILEPELEWEKEGLVPNVVFSCGAVEKDDQIYVYYGGADTVIGAASIGSKELAAELAVTR